MDMLSRKAGKEHIQQGAGSVDGHNNDVGGEGLFSTYKDT